MVASVEMGSVEADYENGVLKPVQPLRLRQGERVALTVQRRPDASRWDLDRLSRTSGLADQELASAGLEEWAQALKEPAQ